MSERTCPHCGRALSVENGAAFCPFCGGALHAAAAGEESAAVLALIKQANALTDPVKKHTLLVQALAEHPDSLAVAEELLLLGRLYERNSKTLDFSVIKSYLLNIYLDPDELSPERCDAMRTELFHHPDLDRCLALAPDGNAFLTHYLTRLSTQFIELFLRGSSRYMHRFFGIGLDSHAPKYLAQPVARMIAAVQADTQLTEEQRSLLSHALYAAFTQLMQDTQWLQEALAERKVTLE